MRCTCILVLLRVLFLKVSMSIRYEGAMSCNALQTGIITLNCMHNLTGSQWSSMRAGVMWSIKPRTM